MRAHRGRERKGLFFLFPPEGLVQGEKGQRQSFSICVSKSGMQYQLLGFYFKDVTSLKFQKIVICKDFGTHDDQNSSD